MKSNYKRLILINIFVFFALLFTFSKKSNSEKELKYAENKTKIGNPIIQKEILTYNEIDSILNTFQKIPYSQLDSEYLKFTSYKGRPDEYKVINKSFYKLHNNDVVKNLVEKHTVNEFLPKDKFWKSDYSIADTNTIHYFLIDNEVLHRFLDLILLLKKSGYNHEAITIIDGYRYPSFNSETGGANYSQHIYGKAIDIEIGDINNDSIIDEKNDKKIVIDFLDKKIIKQSGGIGLYPSTRIVHFDTRGKYARWNEQ